MLGYEWEFGLGVSLIWFYHYSNTILTIRRDLSPLGIREIIPSHFRRPVSQLISLEHELSLPTLLLLDESRVIDVNQFTLVVLFHW